MEKNSVAQTHMSQADANGLMEKALTLFLATYIRVTAAIAAATEKGEGDDVTGPLENERTDAGSEFLATLRQIRKGYRNEYQGHASRVAIVEHNSPDAMLAVIDLFERANEKVNVSRVASGISDDAATAIRNTFTDAFGPIADSVVGGLTDSDEKEFATRVVNAVIETIATEKVRARQSRQVKKSISDMLTDGTITAGTRVVRNGRNVSATVTKDGMLSFNGEKLAASPAATAAGANKNTNGMDWWQVKKDGTYRTLRQVAGD
jgi:membrane-associated HD superfamily phosphohydrolase